jgi:CheY-like chemotaxis protein
MTILLAEDDPGHATLVRRNLKRAGVLNEVVWVQNGKEALDYVRSEGAYDGQQRDEGLIVLLDINMPVMDGVEALERLKADEGTKNVPVMMLTTTDDPREIERCYRLGCSVYITKPVEYEAFREAVKRLGMFLEFVSAPSRNGGGRPA